MLESVHNTVTGYAKVTLENHPSNKYTSTFPCDIVYHPEMEKVYAKLHLVNSPLKVQSPRKRNNRRLCQLGASPMSSRARKVHQNFHTRARRQLVFPSINMDLREGGNACILRNYVLAI